MNGKLGCDCVLYWLHCHWLPLAKDTDRARPKSKALLKPINRVIDSDLYGAVMCTEHLTKLVKRLHRTPRRQIGAANRANLILQSSVDN